MSKFFPQIDDFLISIDGAGIETNVEKAIVEYEIPFADGAICDDLGVKARRFKFKTIWARELYDHYEDFVEHASDKYVKEFIHPELGRIIGRIKNLTIVHDKHKKCATIEIDFIEDVGTGITPQYEPHLISALEESFENICEALTESIGEQLEAAGFDSKGRISDFISGMINGVVNVFAFIKKVSATMSKITNTIQSGIDALNKTINTVVGAVNSVVSLVVFAATLPGAIMGTIARAVDNLKQSLKNIKNAPALFISSFKNGLNNLKSAFRWGSNKTTVMGASLCALAVAEMLIADEEQKAAARQIEDASSPDINGDVVPREIPQTLTANDLEETLEAMTGMINEGIEAAREENCHAAVVELQKTLRLLQKYIIETALMSDRIITVNVESPMHLFTILQRHNVPISYADRVVSINDFRNPNLISGEVRLYERRS